MTTPQRESAPLLIRRASRWPAVLFALVAARSAFADPQQRAAPVPAQPLNQWTDEQFESWVFNQDGSALNARRRFQTLLDLRLDDIDRACALSEPQKKKLQLLGHADIKRIFEGYDKAKQHFNLLNNDVQHLNEIVGEIQLIQSVQNPYQSGSLFYKGLRRTLTEEQSAKYAPVVRERRSFHHRARIEFAVDTLEQSIPLREAQRQQLIELLTKEIKPTEARLATYYFYLIMDQIDRIPEEKLKPIFTAPQWKIVQQQKMQYRGVVQSLRQSGYLSDDDDNNDGPKKK